MLWLFFCALDHDGYNNKYKKLGKAVKRIIGSAKRRENLKANNKTHNVPKIGNKKDILLKLE